MATPRKPKTKLWWEKSVTTEKMNSLMKTIEHLRTLRWDGYESGTEEEGPYIQRRVNKKPRGRKKCPQLWSSYYWCHLWPDLTWSSCTCAWVKSKNVPNACVHVMQTPYMHMKDLCMGNKMLCMKELWLEKLVLVVEVELLLYLQKNNTQFFVTTNSFCLVKYIRNRYSNVNVLVHGILHKMCLMQGPNWPYNALKRMHG